MSNVNESGSQKYFDFLHKLENDAHFCYRYLENCPRGSETWNQCLQTISKDAGISYAFATGNKQRFELGEPAIAEDSKYSIPYAQQVIKDRFLLAEPKIAKNSKDSYDYAKIIVHGRWQEGEEAISKDPNYSFLYARDIIKGRFELGEDAIAQCEDAAFNYATEIIKGKLPEKMHNIMMAKRIAA